MKPLAWISLIVCVIYSVIMFPALGWRHYNLEKDIESVAHRAQVAADAEDMLQYMVTLRDNLEKHDATEGHTALLFKSPENNLSLLYDSVNRIIARLEQVKDLPKSETAYNVALDDIRGTIRELEAPSAGLLWVQTWYLQLAFVIWIWPIVHFFLGHFEDY